MECQLSTLICLLRRSWQETLRGLRPESSWCERNPCFLSSLPCFLFCASVVFHKADTEMELKVQKFYRRMTPVKEKRLRRWIGRGSRQTTMQTQQSSPAGGALELRSPTRGDLCWVQTPEPPLSHWLGFALRVTRPCLENWGHQREAVRKPRPSH